MKTDIETLKDSFRIGYEAFEDSRIEANTVWDMFHNRQYTDSQLNVLANRGQPAETFNIVKLFARMLIGYYSTVTNAMMALPTQRNDVFTASLLSDTISHILRDNSFLSEGDKLKLSGIISGLMCCYTDVQNTGEKDEFGRPVKRVHLQHVPDNEIVLDPLSMKEDYSDARFLHRFKWVSEEELSNLYGKDKLDQLEEYYNFLDIDEAEFEFTYNGQFQGLYRILNNYLVVHTVITDDDGQAWSIHWSDGVELFRKKITFKDTRWPYRVHRINVSNKAEYYGIFREVIETQKAINQALIKIQHMVNTQKAFVETGAVEDITEFTAAFNRVNGVIEVNDLQGIKIEQMSKEILDQYTIIDKAFDRIQRILSINDSFLGMAFASDSGRKVKLQQNATITALRYLTGRIEQFYKLLGWDIVNLVKQFYSATQTMRIVDESVGDRWITLNQPMGIPTGNMKPDGTPEVEYVFEQILDPESGEPMVDESGNYIIAPIPEEDTEITFTKVDIEITTTAYNDEDEKNQVMMETILSGNVGSLLSQVNPGGFFKIASLSIKTMKLKHSIEISKIFEQTAQMLGASPEAENEAKMMAAGNLSNPSSQMSQTMKLPQNTNEGAE